MRSISTGRIAAASLLALLIGQAEARITRIETESVAPSGDGFELISGKAHGEVDPAHRRNGRITDIHLAPQNPHYAVEYTTEFAILRPTGTGSGVLLYDVVNRGNG